MLESHQSQTASVQDTMLESPTEHTKEAACAKSKELHPTLMNYRYVREVDIDNAMTITAREYKGFGTTYDCQNGVIEVNKLGGMADTQSRTVYSSEGLSPTLVAGMDHGNTMPYIVEVKHE